MITTPQMRFTHVRARVLILLPRRFDTRARALNQTKLAVVKAQGAVDDEQVLHPDGRQIRQAQRQPLDEHG